MTYFAKTTTLSSINEHIEGFGFLLVFLKLLNISVTTLNKSLPEHMSDDEHKYPFNPYRKTTTDTNTFTFSLSQFCTKIAKDNSFIHRQDITYYSDVYRYVAGGFMRILQKASRKPAQHVSFDITAKAKTNNDSNRRAFSEYTLETIEKQHGADISEHYSASK
ncbi:hypothetical protein MAR_005254 [Mya arenaria]|uniref:Uncharacterized protein n=1 Tax=Mya arenaria TaxID=6604 RepID=A0ABY7F1D4_MYAAR|nr:hypothetical protein MAR_005254 [Mya arenaria]